MRSRVAVVMSVVLGACAHGGGAGPAPAVPVVPLVPVTKTAKQIVAESKPAIVRVEAGQERVGTGFVIDASGLVATNLHVVAGVAELRVRLLDGTVLAVQRIAAIDLDRDLAILDVDPAQPLPTLALGDSDAVAAGDPVIAIGNPLGVLDYTVSDGLISSVRVVSDQLTLLQISAPISQGSSGGPLFNMAGEVVGLTQAIFTEGQNLNFAIPVNYLATLAAAPAAPLTLAAFVDATTVAGAPGAGTAIVRRVPRHDLSLLDGCSDASAKEAVDAIDGAIAVGAPLYNQGNHEACFRIYEDAAMKLQQGSACPGVRQAFTDGLTRAKGEADYTLKAWAMRDAFDGLVEVILRRLAATPPTP